MATTITRDQAVKLMQVALLTEANRARSFVNILTDQQSAPVAASKDNAGAKQTSYTAPVVRITDLEKTKGDSVDMQIIHQLSKKPTMGDKKIAGRGEDLRFDTYDIRVDQSRHLVDAGGRMSQKRTKWGLADTARVMLGSYFNNLQDQIATVHLAGARGDYLADDTILPLASDPEFAEIMVNPVTPPTYNQHFFGGDATSLEAVESADLITLATIDDIALYIAEMSTPLAPVKMSGDDLAIDDPYYVLYVTPRQWNDLQTSTSMKNWTDMASRVQNRSKGFSSPLFKGQCAMWRNILIRQYGGMPIRFYKDSKVAISNNDKSASVKEVQVKTTIDRAILLGGQALALAYGGMNGGVFNEHREQVDHGNSTEVSISWISGLKKVRFPNKSGYINDLGVIAVDSAITTGRHSTAPVTTVKN